MIQDYSKSHTATWIPSKKGNYLYGMDIKESNSKNDKDTSKYVPIKIEPSIPAELHSLDITGTNEAKTTHTIVAKASGVNGVLYRFHVKDPVTGNWTVIQDYNEKNSVNWSPEKSGNYKYAVHVKDKNSFEDIEAQASKAIEIIPLKPAIAESINIQGNKYENANHVITAKGSSTNGVLYRFHIKDESTGRWSMIQDYSTKNTTNWKPNKIGKYSYLVAMKDKKSDKDKDISISNVVTINPPIYYNVTEYKDTLEQALDKQIGKNTISKGGKWVTATKNEIREYINPDRFLQFKPEAKLNNENQYVISIQILTSGLNVRKEPNTTSTILTTASKGNVYIVLDQENGWHKINIGGKIGWISGDYAQYINDVPREMYQFMVLSGQFGVTTEQLNIELKNKGILEGKGAAFISASKKTNINELYLMAHAMLETGKGTSRLATGIMVDTVDGKPVEPRKTYNMYGIRAFDRDAERMGSEFAYKSGWFTPEIAIIEGAQWISNGYINKSTNPQDTLYKMKYNPASPGYPQYATDIAWAFKQIKQIDNMMEYARKMDGLVLRFDIPKYK